MFQTSLRSSQDRAAANLDKSTEDFPSANEAVFLRASEDKGASAAHPAAQAALFPCPLLTVGGYPAKVQTPTSQVKPETCDTAMLVTARALGGSFTSLRPVRNVCRAPK